MKQSLLKQLENDAIATDSGYVKVPLFLFSEIMDMLRENEWIPVSERVPKSIANKVAVFLQHEDLVDKIGYGHYEKYKGMEIWYDLETNEPFSFRGFTVTHWMPMPKSPDGEKLCLD